MNNSWILKTHPQVLYCLFHACFKNKTISWNVHEMFINIKCIIHRYHYILKMHDIFLNGYHAWFMNYEFFMSKKTFIKMHEMFMNDFMHISRIFISWIWMHDFMNDYAPCMSHAHVFTRARWQKLGQLHAWYRPVSYMLLARNIRVTRAFLV